MSLHTHICKHLWCAHCSELEFLDFSVRSHLSLRVSLSLWGFQGFQQPGQVAIPFSSPVREDFSLLLQVAASAENAQVFLTVTGKSESNCSKGPPEIGDSQVLQGRINANLLQQVVWTPNPLLSV